METQAKTNGAIFLVWLSGCILLTLWLAQQEYSVREGWLLRLAFLAVLAPLAALALPTVAGICVVLSGVTCVILGFAYCSDMGVQGHGLTAGLLGLAGMWAFGGGFAGMWIREQVIEWWEWRIGTRIETNEETSIDKTGRSG